MSEGDLYDWAVTPITYVTADGERFDTEEWTWIGPRGLPAETLTKIREAIGNSRSPEDSSRKPVIVSAELFDTFERILPRVSRYMDTKLANEGHENLLYHGVIPIVRENVKEPT